MIDLPVPESPPNSEIRALRMAAVMSVPLCGFNPHWGCHSAALRPLGIGVKLAFGAFWHHGISNLFEDCVEAGIDWILTLDYDSLFTSAHVDQLIRHAVLNPEMDAIAALQAKRGTEGAMLVTVPECDELAKDDQGRVQINITSQPIEVTTAHFGLTMIRTAALARMPKPWFLDLPDKDGSYRTRGRCDADMYFWRTFREAGCRAFVDMHCRIGHLDAYSVEIGDDYKTKLVHVHEWRREAYGVHTVQHAHEDAPAEAVAA